MIEVDMNNDLLRRGLPKGRVQEAFNYLNPRKGPYTVVLKGAGWPEEILTPEHIIIVRKPDE